MRESAELMGTAPIPRLILHFALPATVGVLANALYNIVDRLFIGHYVGADGLAAVSIAFPLVVSLSAMSTLIGTGTASQISRALGAGHDDDAQIAFGNGLFASFTVILLMQFLVIHLPQVVRVCGATEYIAPLATRYMRITVPAMPAPLLAMVLMATMRSEGHPQYAMWGLVLSASLNVVLDWWFIAGLNMGLEGAAWGTVLAQIFSLLWVGVFFVSRKGILRIRLSSMRPRLPVLGEMVAVGVSPFLINIFFALMMVLFNHYLGRYGGELALSAMGIFFSIDSLLFMPVTGIGEGSMPVMGYNYGARNFKRLRQTVKMALSLAVGYYLISTVAALVWPEIMAAPFASGNVALITLTARSIRIGYCLLPLGAINTITGYTLEALGRARIALYFNLSRQLIALGLLFVLPGILGTDGVWTTLPAIDFIGGVSGIVILRYESQKWHE